MLRVKSSGAEWQTTARRGAVGIVQPQPTGSSVSAKRMIRIAGLGVARRNTKRELPAGTRSRTLDQELQSQIRVLPGSYARARAGGSSGAYTAAMAGGAHKRARLPLEGLRARLAVQQILAPARPRSAYAHMGGTRHAT